MKRMKQLTAVLLALSTVFSLTGCGEKQPYKERLAEYLSAFENKDADDLLELMNEDAFFDGMEKVFEDDEDFYACLGYDDAEDFAEVSLENWLDSLCEGEDFESFTYTVEHSEKVEPESVKLPDHQKIDITKAYRVSLAFECEDAVTLEFLEDNLSELYAVQAEDEEWYFVNSAFEVTVDGAQEKAYEFMMLYQDADEDAYFDSLSEWDHTVLNSSYAYFSDASDLTMEELAEATGYASVDEMIEGDVKSIFISATGNCDEWSFTLGEAEYLDEEEFTEAVKNMCYDELEIEVDSEKYVRIEVQYDIDYINSYFPDELILAEMDDEWVIVDDEGIIDAFVFAMVGYNNG